MRTLLFGATAAFQVRTLVMPVVSTLRGHGWDVHVASSGAISPGSLDGVPFHHIEMSRSISPIQDLRSLGAWLRLVRRLRPQAIVSGSPKASLLGIFAARVYSVPVRVYLVRGLRWQSETGTRRRLLLAMERLTVRHSTHVVAVSHSVAEELHIEAGVPHSRITVIGRGGSKGVDLEKYRFVQPQNDRPTIGYVGRLATDKGIDTLFRVFDAVRRQIPDCQLVVVGAFDESQPLPEEIANRLKGPHVMWLGHRDDLEHCYPMLDMLVFPSHREGMPNVVLEAAACGVPTVAWDVTGVRDSIVHASTGFLLPFGNEEVMAEHVVRLLSDFELRRAMGRRAYDFCTSNFDAVLVQGRFADFLNDAAKGADSHFGVSGDKPRRLL